MTIAIILAGGSGVRMGEKIPKQFLEIEGKPVLAYTLEGIQRHPLIDAIEVVCIPGWEETIRAYGEQYGITKLRYFAPGGATCQESIRNGVEQLREQCTAEDIIVIHDGIRPLLAPEVLTDVIRVCREHGNAVTAMPYHEQIFVADDECSTTQFIPRDRLRRVSTPQAYRYGVLRAAYERAFREGIGIAGASYTNTMMVELGERLYFALGSERNIKLTTPDDLALFRALLHQEDTP